MKGLEVKEKLIKDGHKLSDIAQIMSITPQSLHKLLLSEDIKTGVLERIAKAIDKEIMYFFNIHVDTNDEITLINEITHRRKLIYFLYQKIVDVSVLNKDYFDLTDTLDVDLAAQIMHNCINPIPGGHSIDSREIRISDIEDWKTYSLDKKKWFNAELKESVRLLQDIFFDRFDLLYKKVRKFD